METLHSINGWKEGFHALNDKFFSQLGRTEVIDAATSYVRGLLLPLAKKNGWSLAEAAGKTNPQAHQRLLRSAVWDHEELRQNRQDFIVEHYDDSGGMLIFDETGVLKRGTKSVGVARQYTGTVGKTENCQIGVFSAYVANDSHVLWDSRLYLPKDWCTDDGRLENAGVPTEVRFRTKPEQAWQMYEKAIERGLSIRWVTADTVYGDNPGLRANLIDARQKFVMAVSCNTHVYPRRPLKMHPAGPQRRRRRRARRNKKSKRVDEMVADWPQEDFRPIVVGDGSKGPRVYLWAARRVAAVTDDGRSDDLWLVVRRSPSSGKMSYYLAWAPARTPLTTLARIASKRWHIEECFAEAKGEIGLADYQVRKWVPWHRHIELSMLAHLMLVEVKRQHGESDEELPPLTLPEVRRLLEVVLPPPPRPPQARLHWSNWRRRHHQRARESHYRSRLRPPPNTLNGKVTL